MAVNNLFLSEAIELLKCFPKLELVDTGSGMVIAGSVDLITHDGEILDNYKIEIHPPVDYPESFPIVYETNGRLPKNIDWHIYDDGHFCLATPAEERLECATGIKLHTFFQKYVLGFLFGQTFKQKNGYFHQERSHGILGRLEHYKDILGIKSYKSLLNVLKAIIAGKEFPAHSKCYCGSCKKFKKCHRIIWRRLESKVGGLIRQDYSEVQILIAHTQTQSTP